MVRYVVAVCLCVFLVIKTGAQNIDSVISAYAENYQQEKAYLHFDKSAYAPGDIIWFKVYLTAANYPALDSKTFYADWTDNNGKLIARTVHPVIDGSTNGDLEIPADFKGEYIHVRAYTKWMLNFDSAFLYNKDIRIIQPMPTKAKLIPDTVSLQFFPEGGDLVEGVNNRVAFKTNDQWGRPADIKGIIQNNKGKFIDSLRVLHDGMGSFFIQPAAGETFTAKWKAGKGKEQTTTLPQAKIKGASLQVAIEGTKRLFTITRSSDGPKTVHIIGTMNQFEIFKLSKDISSAPGKGIIPTDQLPSGILTITVFDETWEPLAERITFINNHDYEFHPEFSVEHWGLSKRARSDIRITIPDSLVANLSVAVTDVALNADSSNHIISDLLLTGDLKGYVHKPAFYFQEGADPSGVLTDLVMLTHGWRRFNWQKAAKGELPATPYNKDTSYITVSGQVMGLLPSQLRGAGDITVIVKQDKQEMQVIAAPIQQDGSFNASSLILFDTAQVYYQFSNKKEFGAALVKFLPGLVPPLSGAQKAKGLPSLYNDSYQLGLAGEAATLRKFAGTKLLENITVTSKKKTPLEQMDEKYASGLFSSGDGYQFDLVNDPFASSQSSIFNYLQGKVAGLQISTNGSEPSLSWRGGSPQIYLDENPVDASMVSSIPVTDVAYVKVFRPPFMGPSAGGANGAIVIYTRRGGDVKQEPGKGLANNKVTGYTINKEFYSPNYYKTLPENEARDVRTTLYWNPQVILTPKEKSAVLNFFNNDVSKSFRVIIEGMTADGRLAHIEEIME